VLLWAVAIEPSRPEVIFSPTCNASATALAVGVLTGSVIIDDSAVIGLQVVIYRESVNG
jgi:hypothetical protein